MRVWIRAACGTVLLLAVNSALFAQWTANKVQVRGLFGDRVLGETLRPRPSQFGSGLWRGPSGNFLGRNSSSPSAMFPAYSPPADRRPVLVAPPFRVEQPFREPPIPGFEEPGTPSLQPSPQPVQQPAPEIWFRAPGTQRQSRATPAMNGTVGRNLPSTLPSGPQMSIAMEVGFEPQRRPSVQVSPSLSGRISQMAGDRVSSPITVSVSGGQATLRGVVKTPYDRVVIGAMALMEPGIWQVRNELTVEPQTAFAGASPSPVAR